MKWKCNAIVLGLLLALAPSVNAAPVLRVDIGGDFATGGSQVVQSGWSAFDLHELYLSVPGITDTVSHTYGPISMSITTTIYGETVGFTFSQGPYPVGVTIPSVYDDAALANVYGSTVGGGMKIEISGLTPGQKYSVAMWHWANGVTGENVDWYDDSSGHVLIGNFATAAALPTSDTDYKDTFLASANGSGKLIFSASTGPNTGHFAVNALELSEVAAVPGPGTLAMLLFGISVLTATGVMRRDNGR